MRILIVNKFARVTGGADACCLDFAAAMRARGHEVAFLATSNPANVETDGAFIPATVTRENKQTLSARRQLRAASSAFWNRTAYDAMHALIATFRPDVVSAHKLYPQLSVSPLIAAKRAGVPVVQTVYDYEFVSASPLDDTGGWLDANETSARFRALNTSLFAVKLGVHRRSITRWIAISEFVSQRLRLRGIDAHVVPIPSPLPVGKPIPFGDRRGLAFAGRLEPEKGVAHLIRLAELLPSLNVVVAGDGPARSAFEDAAARLPNLSYLGWIDRKAINKLFGGALAVVVPSTWQEPGGLVALEAMALGTPLVVYDVGGLSEYVGNAGAGMVVRPRSESLAAACDALVGDARAWKQFSGCGISAAKGHHSLNSHCETVERVYADATRVAND